MGECCDPGGYGETFGRRFARRTARRHRRRGFSRAERSIIDFIDRNGVDGASVLEIGGGVGDLHVELLRRGASHVTNLELSLGYEAEAAELLATTGVGERVTRRMIDIAPDPDAVEPADVVMLHRVVCCYPDYARLLGAASGHARRLLVFSYPAANLFVRTAFWLENMSRRLERNDFRTFVHPPAAMYAVAEAQGLAQRLDDRRGLAWHVAGFQRCHPPAR